MAAVVEVVKQYKTRLEKEKDEKKILRIFEKLNELDVSRELLQVTGIGKTIHSFRKWDGKVGSASRQLVAEWKQSVRQNEKQTVPNTHANSGYNSSQSTINGVQDNWINTNDSKGINGMDGSVIGVRQNAKKTPRSVTVEREDSYTLYGDDGQVPSYLNDPLKTERTGTKYLRKSNVELAPSSAIKASNSSRDKANKTPERRSDHRDDVKGTCSKKSIVTANLAFEPGQDAFALKKHKKHLTGNIKVEPDLDPISKPTRQRANGSSEQGFNASMASFEDCLSFNDIPSKRRKNFPPALSLSSGPLLGMKSTTSNSRDCTDSSVGSSYKKSFKLDLDLPLGMEFGSVLSLPEIQPDYKPLSRYMYPAPDSPPRRKKSSNPEADNGVFISSKNNRTQVFSGRRSYIISEIPSLFQLCIKVLQDNLRVLEYDCTLGYRYYILKPVFERCPPVQLCTIEDNNPDLIGDTDELWQIHCQRDFKNSSPLDHELWRDLYLRLHHEREAKLKNITANISAAHAKNLPVRRIQLAFVDCDAKPPRNVARQQAKFGTKSADKKSASKQPPGSKAAAQPSTSKGKLIQECLATNSVMNPLTPGSSSSSSSTSSSQQKVVKKVAPLMQKTLKFMKNRFRR